MVQVGMGMGRDASPPNGMRGRTVASNTGSEAERRLEPGPPAPMGIGSYVPSIDRPGTNCAVPPFVTRPCCTRLPLHLVLLEQSLVMQSIACIPPSDKYAAQVRGDLEF